MTSSCCDGNKQKESEARFYGQIPGNGILPVTEGLILRTNLKNRRFARKDVSAPGLISTAFGKIIRIDENRDFVRKLFLQVFSLFAVNLTCFFMKIF